MRIAGKATAGGKTPGRFCGCSALPCAHRQSRAKSMPYKTGKTLRRSSGTPNAISSSNHSLEKNAVLLGRAGGGKSFPHGGIFLLKPIFCNFVFVSCVLQLKMRSLQEVFAFFEKKNCIFSFSGVARQGRNVYNGICNHATCKTTCLHLPQTLIFPWGARPEMQPG